MSIRIPASSIDLHINRSCVGCGSQYNIESQEAGHYYQPPHNYGTGCLTHCLSCWLGLGPDNVSQLGHLLKDLAFKVSPERHIVLMPMPRVYLEHPVRFEYCIFYPPHEVDLDGLSHFKVANEGLAFFQSKASGVDAEVICQEHTVAFSAELEWQDVLHANHEDHMQMLRSLSEIVDKCCLDFMRFSLCSLDMVDDLPGRAGQLTSNKMMAGAAIFNLARCEACIVGGAAFTHYIVRGLGLEIDRPIECFPMPDGEVGHIVESALNSYRTVLEADNQTSKFMQAMSLLEFLVSPDKYTSPREYIPKIASYVSNDASQFEHARQRLEELHGKKDENGQHIGYRTRIVHLGKSLDDILPSVKEQKSLFVEIDRIIRTIINHMLRHTQMDWEEYRDVRRQMGPFGLKGSS